MQFNYVTSPYMRALIRKYEFERDEAIANLYAFFEHGVGVGDHSNIVASMDEQVSKLESAEGKLKSLIAHFAVQPQPQPQPSEEQTNES